METQRPFESKARICTSRFAWQKGPAQSSPRSRKGFQNRWFWRRSFLPFFRRRKKGSRGRHSAAQSIMDCHTSDVGHPLAMTGFAWSALGGGTHGCRPTGHFAGADGPVRPARDTQHFCRAGPCALPGRYGARPARARQSPAPTDDLQISVDGPMWALAPTHNNRRGRGRPRGSPLRGAGSNGLPQPVTSVTGFAMTGFFARGTVQDRAAGEYAQDRFGSSGRPTPKHVYR